MSSSARSGHGAAAGSTGRADGFLPSLAALPVVVVLALAAFDATWGITSSPGFAVAAVATMLVFGLPHGALDMVLLREAGIEGSIRFLSALALYVGIAAVTGALWLLSPIMACSLFLLIGIVHFAEDWRALLPAPIPLGIALALISAPTFLHGDTLAQIFAVLVPAPDAATLVALLSLVAPMAIVTSGVGIAMLAAVGRWIEAGTSAAAIAAMLLLPPLAGFVIFFGFIHSPLNYRAALARLCVARAAAARRDSLWLSLAGLGIASAIAALSFDAAIDDRWLRAGFVTLSVLTVPHLVASLYMARRAARA